MPKPKKSISKSKQKIKIYKRPSWDEYFLGIVDEVGKRGTCDRGRSGAVITKNNRILSTGYVGAPMGLPHCDEAGHLMNDVINEEGNKSRHCIRTTHAEQNAIALAARHGVSIDGGTLYCKMAPCYVCAKMLINTGIKRVVCQKGYHGAKLTPGILRKAGVKLKILDKTFEQYKDMK